eukprot:TRINITY_DN27151_c0_g1_i1.p1 TRINITY_DN27151_c0_g1~~TRINITY_DN27151_c0_g1_i1.p1  ORF type:complete len:281 (+),score=83.15 TRINITY_DN27151_c0_g1_i1:61-903(+)
MFKKATRMIDSHTGGHKDIGAAIESGHNLVSCLKSLVQRTHAAVGTLCSVITPLNPAFQPHLQQMMMLLQEKETNISTMTYSLEQAVLHLDSIMTKRKHIDKLAREMVAAEKRAAKAGAATKEAAINTYEMVKAQFEAARAEEWNSTPLHLAHYMRTYVKASRFYHTTACQVLEKEEQLVLSMWGPEPHNPPPVALPGQLPLAPPQGDGVQYAMHGMDDMAISKQQEANQQQGAPQQPSEQPRPSEPVVLSPPTGGSPSGYAPPVDLPPAYTESEQKNSL